MPYGFPVYANDYMRLVLTGQGAWPAATAVSGTLAYYHAAREDLLVNWGSCGSNLPVGSVFRCNQIIDGRNGFAYYPDMIYQSSVKEAAVVTEPQIWKRETRAEDDIQKYHVRLQEILHDMEAAAVYYAASFYLAPHQMLFFKAVTDNGNERLSFGILEQRMGQAGMLLIQELNSLIEIQDLRNLNKKNLKSQKDAEEWEQLCLEFHCSQTMKLSLLQCIRYWKLAGVDYQEALEEFRASGLLPCKNKSEGKKRIEQLKARLLL